MDNGTTSALLTPVGGGATVGIISAFRDRDPCRNSTVIAFSDLSPDHAVCRRVFGLPSEDC